MIMGRSKKKNLLGYDVGGGAFPLSPQLTVIDYMSVGQFLSWNPKCDASLWHYVQQDLREPGWGMKFELEPRQFVYCSRLLRYLENEEGSLGKIEDVQVYYRFADEIVKLCAPGGSITIYDHTSYVKAVRDRFVEYLSVCNWYFFGEPRIIEDQSGDSTSESVLTITRNPNS